MDLSSSEDAEDIDEGITNLYCWVQNHHLRIQLGEAWLQEKLTDPIELVTKPHQDDQDDQDDQDACNLFTLYTTMRKSVNNS